MQGDVLVILAASKIKDDYASIFNTVPAMLPFRGKPLVYQIILNFIQERGNKKKKGIVFVALPSGEEHIGRFLEAALGGKIDLYCSYFNNAQSFCQAQTLQTLLNMMSNLGIRDASTVIANGDIYFEFPLVPKDQAITALVNYSFSDGRYSHYFLDQIQKVHYIEVGQGIKCEETSQLFIDCGVYYVPSWKAIKKAEQRYSSKCTVGKFLCDITQGDLQLIQAKKWIDLGNLDSATAISTKVLGAREFNQLQIDEKRGLITKSSVNKEKILQEINYYNNLPLDLKIFFPRLYSFNLGRSVNYSIEYYPYKTLSEYYVMYELSEGCWGRIFDKIFEVYAEFRNHKGCIPSRDQWNRIYLGKLCNRLEKVKENLELYTLTEMESILINGQRYNGWKYYFHFIEEVITKAYGTCTCSVIHGDLCFSNILYEPSTNIIKFIDPRGDFFEEGVYGDPNYDLAKLLHSLHGGYDFIIHQMYSLEESHDGGYNFQLIQSDKADSIKEVFLSRLRRDFSTKEIQKFLVLEAMLFLSMLPLHKDDKRRQKAFYFTALQILKQAKEYC